jgi:hypothetical protein
MARLCFKSAAANCGTGDPAESGYHCCCLTIGHVGPCSCDECAKQFDPDGIPRTIGEVKNAALDAIVG